MFFYEDFIKKIDGNIQGEGREKFGLDAKKAMLWLGTGIPFLIAGVLEIYIANQKGMNKTDFFAGIVFLFLSFRHLRMYFTYKIILDFNDKKLVSKDIVFGFNEVRSCTLKEQTIGRKKKMQTVIDVVLNDGREVIIPLMMNKKLKFVNLIKSEIKNKFTIQK